MSNYEDRVFQYVIDLNERGIFNAHVQDQDGNVIYCLDNETEDGEIPAIQDGYMQNVEDMDGLAEYLIMLGFIPEESSIEYMG